MTPSPTLLCIPDISGFTEFMGNADIEKSSLIIPALLNEIIYSNEIEFRVSEIEGDAVLFYRKGDLPPFQDLVDQCKAFYTQFYEKINELMSKYKQEKQITEFPEILGLKIILHFGDEISMVQIGNHIKLMGEDVITVHRLLKNNVPLDEYLLFSDDLLQRYKDTKVEDQFDWATLQEGAMDIEHLGKLKYHYIPLEPLTEDQ
ncbi:MAG: DUF2652 domain-containing protein [Marinirhabdus sp.]|nr:DUF2652 domain-containing protein [Marinirhabdus sp.]